MPDQSSGRIPRFDQAYRRGLRSELGLPDRYKPMSFTGLLKDLETSRERQEIGIVTDARPRREARANVRSEHGCGSAAHEVTNYLETVLKSRGHLGMIEQATPSLGVLGRRHCGKLYSRSAARTPEPKTSNCGLSGGNA